MYAPLTIAQRKILNQVKEQNILKKPNLMSQTLVRRITPSIFYRDHGYDIEECFELKEEIKNLIC